MGSRGARIDVRSIRRARPGEARARLAVRARARRIREAAARSARRPRPTIEDGAVWPPTRACSGDIAEWDGEPAGFAVWFLNFSTFSGRSGIYLEDSCSFGPALRGKGIGKGLLAHLRRGMRRQRLVAPRNGRCWTGTTPSIEFYKSLGAEADGRVDGLPRRRCRR